MGEVVEYIIYGFENDKRDPLGYFLCRDVEACSGGPQRISLVDLAGIPFTVTFDLELTHYVITIPEEHHAKATGRELPSGSP